MALQTSGAISIGNIRAEMALTGISPFSLDLAANGIYVPLNPYSPTHPITAGGGVYGMAGTNESVSSWYGYCHFCSIACSLTATGLTSVYNAVVDAGNTSGTISVVVTWIHPAGFHVYYGNPYNSSGTLVGTAIYATSGNSGTTTATFGYVYNGSTTLLYVYADFAVASWSLSCPTSPTTTTTTTAAPGYRMTINAIKNTNVPGSVYVWYSINGGAYSKNLTGAPITTGGGSVGSIVVPFGQSFTVAVSDVSGPPVTTDYADNANVGGPSYPSFASCTCHHYISFTPSSSQTIYVAASGNACP
jgi:hypothetical protein